MIRSQDTYLKNTFRGEGGKLIFSNLKPPIFYAEGWGFLFWKVYLPLTPPYKGGEIKRNPSSKEGSSITFLPFIRGGLEG
jgi:hypothetical protein